MSEVADGSELAVKAEESATKRKSTPLGDKIKVTDFLRSRIEPVSADSGAAIAALVSEGAKVDINWNSLKYMIDDPSMADYKLSEKIHIKSPLSAEEQAQAQYERMIALEARVLQLEEQMVQATAAMLELTNPNLLL